MSKTLRSINFKDRTFQKLSEGTLKRNEKAYTSGWGRKFQTKISDLDGFKIVTSQKNAADSVHIVLLHGGAYFAQATRSHQSMLKKLTGSNLFKISLLNYPLAPENIAVYTLNWTFRALQHLFEQYPDDRFMLIGDSAGGGLALSMLHRFRDQNVEKQPHKTILLSPWLDLRMSNPEISAYEETDVILSKSGLIKCAEIFAGDMDVDDAQISPLFGNQEHLNEIRLYVSDQELFYPDCILFYEEAKKAQGTKISLKVEAGMMHDWTLLPLKESKRTIREIRDFIMKD